MIRGDDLIIDSTFLRVWSLKDTAAGWYYRVGQASERFGFKVHTILCRWSTLPVLFVVTPANVHDSVVAIPLFRAVKAIYGFAIRIVRADAAYWNYAFLGFIRTGLHATFVIDYNLRKSGEKFLATLFFISQWKHHLGKRSVIERFFAFAVDRQSMADPRKSTDTDRIVLTRMCVATATYGESSVGYFFRNG